MRSWPLMLDIRKSGQMTPDGPWTVWKRPGWDDSYQCQMGEGYRWCHTDHRTKGASKRHCEKLNRKEARGSK